MTSTTVPLLAADHMTRRFERLPDLAARLANRLGASFDAQIVRAVDDVSLTIHRHEVVGLVGESGCGKSTLGRIVAGIDQPTSGRIAFDGKDVATLDGRAAVGYALKVQMVFQDPLDALNPRHTMRRIVGEAARYHQVVGKAELPAHVENILVRCGLDPSTGNRFPHQFSGGQRQRIGIARALAVKPELLVCDEAVASLDVSIQAQIINLFIELRDSLGLAYLFVSHDIGVIRHVSDRVMVMYLGRIVESGPAAEVLKRPCHPYTRALLEQVPSLARRHSTFNPIRGEIPSPLAPPPGCHFHPRCPHATERCRIECPTLREVAPAHASACHLN